jgi:hypothetical protein
VGFSAGAAIASAQADEGLMSLLLNKAQDFRD